MKSILDIAISILIFYETIGNRLTITDDSNNSYTIDFLDIDKNQKNMKKNTLQYDEIINIDYLGRLIKFVIENYDNRNLFIPFKNNEITPFIELKYLEYYRFLEFLNAKNKRAVGKKLNKDFMNKYLKEYNTFLAEYFDLTDKGNSYYEEILRSLRNYYSHTGYYIEKLPVPTENPKKYIDISYKDICNYTFILKIFMYLEIYNEIGIKVTPKIIKDKISLKYHNRL